MPLSTSPEPVLSAPAAIEARPSVGGKFLWRDRAKLYVRGVTYGTFRPDEAGQQYPDAGTVERDFEQMAASGFNAIRTYTVPPRWLLDLGQEQGLSVMVGLPWEQHVAFLQGRRRARSIERRVREGVRACAGHPAVLCYSVGNEIPAPIVRWHGRRPVERFVERLYDAAKDEDPDGLVTYVNYPSTEYLELPFLDLLGFNVYLEQQRSLEAYLARLHNLAGDRPLLMAEIGLDSRTNGEEAQARVLEWQVDTTFAAGCAGAFVFAWTDEWHRGGHEIEDWDFGLTDRDRNPKPALAAVRATRDRLPIGDRPWPSVSVVVCTYNGERTLPDCLAGLAQLDYPDFERIVVDDGSTDGSAAIAAEHGCRVISTENRGLSSARNTGMDEATGEIIAYLDDDARPDPQWLRYLAAAFTDGVAAVGGPNIAPPDDGPIADCVANAPGGPIHVLTSDREAEHIPGCNMAFRTGSLREIGGFDPRFHVAGDDVDVCWRVQHAGGKIGFSHAAMVWHHRRNSVRAYWRQQRAYGEAEAMLERKWPEKYNSAGHLSWTGRLYGPGLSRSLLSRRRVRYGMWGSGLFQSIYEPARGTLASLPLMPEWYGVIASLAAVASIGALWSPLLVALPLLCMAVVALLLEAALGASRASLAEGRGSRRGPLRLRTLTAVLYLLQPLARLRGRLGRGLTPWRRRATGGLALPRLRSTTAWSEQWRSQDDWVARIETQLSTSGITVRRGGDFDRWELEVRGGVLGFVRVRTAIEEHGAGAQLIRFRSWPRASRFGLVLSAVMTSLAVGAALDGAWSAGAILATLAALIGVGILKECSSATATLTRGIERSHGGPLASAGHRPLAPTGHPLSQQD